MHAELIIFFIVAAVAIVSAVVMVTRTNPIKSVLFLIVNFFALSVLYLFLQAQFIAIIQILVYAGAIMVLFLFVIMLLNVGDEQALAEKKNYKKLFAFVLGGGVFVEIVTGVSMAKHGMDATMSRAMANLGTVESMGKSLFTDFLFPFEAVSMLLLAAMVGVIVLAKKNVR